MYHRIPECGVDHQIGKRDAEAAAGEAYSEGNINISAQEQKLGSYPCKHTGQASTQWGMCSLERSQVKRVESGKMHLIGMQGTGGVRAGMGRVWAARAKEWATVETIFIQQLIWDSRRQILKNQGDQRAARKSHCRCSQDTPCLPLQVSGALHGCCAGIDELMSTSLFHVGMCLAPLGLILL
jgi:hypothetical protein